MPYSSVAVPYALTTYSRIAARLTVSSPSDALALQFDRYINSVTDYIEGRTGRRFLLTKYTNEVYSFLEGVRQSVVLKQAPIVYVQTTATVTVNSTSATLAAADNRIKVGMPILGDGIAAGTTVAAVTGTALTLSQNASATYSALSSNISIIGLVSVQYRAGTPSNPTWTGFITDQFELVGDGKSGLVRVYGNLYGMNNLRATYWAGYLIDFTHEGDPTQHSLPYDLTELAERLVIRAYKRRDAEAEKTVSGPQSSVTWADFVDDIDIEVIDRYSRAIFA